jgi:hypothetical protein
MRRDARALAFFVLVFLSFAGVLFLAAPGLALAGALNLAFDGRIAAWLLWALAIASSLGMFGAIWLRTRTPAIADQPSRLIVAARVYLFLCAATVTVLAISRYGFKARFPSEIVGYYAGEGATGPAPTASGLGRASR